MTKLKFVNYFILQFFFVRLTRCTENVIYDYKVHNISFVNDKGLSIGGQGKIRKEQWYSLQFWILPFTGWSTDFIYLSKKPLYFRLTKSKIVK